MARDTSGGIQRGQPVTLEINQRKVAAHAGETLATILLAEGITTFNRTARGRARGPYCNMGTCYECQVQLSLDALQPFHWVRACMVSVQGGMAVITGACIHDQPAMVDPAGQGSREVSQPRGGHERND